ncbi:hypothetical protein EJ02DRAFT_471311 [Clathrospora elynae]|uniref:Uncharacterized protein n=1 Tax=Clathrospora elynae TaxID=706981 RepID=A0A6A5SCX5_9PLEO|nr:hypothetical protein EJ02DRAFT_471311 [Clathrospora elynae]
MTCGKGKRRVKLTPKGKSYAHLLRQHLSSSSRSSELGERSDTPLTPPEFTQLSQPAALRQQQDAYKDVIELSSGSEGEEEEEEDESTLFVPPGPGSSAPPRHKPIAPPRRKPSVPPQSVQTYDEDMEDPPEGEDDGPDGAGATEDEDVEEVDEGDPVTDAEDFDVKLPRVNFMARWRAFLGKERLPCLQTSSENSHNLSLQGLFEWAKTQVNKQLPVRYSITSLTAAVYFTGQPKQSYWVQSLEEEKGTTFSVLLRLLQKKREERKARTRGPVKDIWVDFDLYVAPASAPASNIPIRGIGNQFGSGQTPTERMLNQLPTVQAQLLATEGHASDVIIHWKCTHRGCRNHPLTCWVALKDGVSSVLDPSENVRSLLRQEKERARGGKKDGTVSVLLEEIAGVKELLLRISQAYAAKGAAELAANIPKSEYAPFGSQYPPFRLLQAFFQWWYDQTPKHDTTMQADITYLGNLAVRADWSLDFICNPCKISLQLWREVTLSCSLKRLYQMRTQIEQFVEDKHWETYINKETGWNQADFEPEILRQLAAEAEDLLALGIE